MGGYKSGSESSPTFARPTCSIFAAIPSNAGLKVSNPGKWMARRALLIVPAQAIASQVARQLQGIPARVKPASFSLSEVMEKMETAPPGQN